MLNQKYLIGHAIGEGGFGITYIGRDTTLDMKVAVKEYFPSGFVNRNGTVSPVVTSSVSHGNQNYFQKGRDRFLAEARVLAKFSGEPGVVCVRDYFEENNTAYIVMEYLSGETLRDHIKRQGRLSPEDTIRLLTPIMESLEKIHRQGLIHRDISPDNIMMQNGQVKLLDFGAARSATSDSDKSLSVLLKPGYAPEEQYRSKGRQGPWTDVYALCATMYKCITGITPDESIQRAFQDDLKSPSALGIAIHPKLEAAILKGLSVHQSNRFQNMEELLDGLDINQNESFANIPTISSNVTPPMNSDDVPTELVTNVEDDSATDQKEQNHPVTALAKVGRKTLAKQTASKDPQSTVNGLSLKRKVAIVILTALAVVAILLIRSNAGKVTVAGDKIGRDTHQIFLSNQAITAADLQGMAKLEELQTLTFMECSFSPDTLPLFRQLPDSLQWLQFSSCIGLTSLDGLSALHSLTNLTITDCSLTDDILQGLQGLDSLRMVDLSRNSALSDISPLTSNWEVLTSIHVDHTAVTDFSSLTDLVNLRTFSARDNGIIDLSTLGNQALVSLSLDQNQIVDLSALSALTQLYDLSLCDNQISDLSPLSGLTALSQLYLNNNRIADIQPLAAMTSLTSLAADDNSIQSLLPLSQNRQLKYLSVNRNALTSLEGLSMALELKDLYAAGNQIANLDGISNCTTLTKIDLTRNQISDLTVLHKSAATLRKVLLANNAIVDISPLTDTTALEYLSLDNNAISDLDALRSSSALLALSANNNQINSVVGLLNAVKLRHLYLANNLLESTFTLQSLSEKAEGDYMAIDLSGNRITYLGGNLPLKKNVRYLAIYGNPLTSLKGIPDNISGTSLLFSYVEGMDVSGFKDNFSRFYILDCPLDKQVAVKSALVGEYGLGANFSDETAAADVMQETRPSELMDASIIAPTDDAA